MIDIKAAALSGARDIAKARVLYQHGVLRAFDKSGKMVFEAISGEPKPLAGWRRTWTCATSKGTLQIEGKCLCGFWRMARRDALELWGTA